MPYIKKLVMHGFKSFAKKTELPFTPEINVVLGPNGSGKSNISDALCFVLGRLSIKSLRAAKAGNLVFLGTKSAAPAREATVELVFDNSDKTFSIEKNEVSIKRIVRKNGQSIYKINNETKTRQEILFLLAQAGIDSNGFNIILQGEIQNLVRMHPEERRQIIEEVSGISIYETRKQKSLKELEKTEEKLKEVLAILRERTSYLNNLEKERQQALRFKKLEKDLKKLKASLINLEINKKTKDKNFVLEKIKKNQKEISKLRKNISDSRLKISGFESKTNLINSTMQKSTGFEQEKLNREIANIRADLAGLEVKIENFKKKLADISRQKTELEKTVRENEVSIKELKKETPATAKKQEDLEIKKKELEGLEEKRKKFYMAKTELKSIEHRIEDKKNLLNNYSNESEFLLKQINLMSIELFDKRSSTEKINELKNSLDEKRILLNEIENREKEFEKIVYANEHEIERQKKLSEKISKIDICPVCKSKITKEHIHRIEKDAKEKIEKLGKETENSDKTLSELSGKKEILKREIESLSSEISKRESDIIKINSIEEKKYQIKTLQEKMDSVKKDISSLENDRKKLESEFNKDSNIEQRYETVKLEVQEISLRSEENIDSEVSFKQRELNRAKVSLRQFSREEEELESDLSSAKKVFHEKEARLEKKRKQEEDLTEKFNELIRERDGIQKKIREEEIEILNREGEIRGIEQETNMLNIETARISAEIEGLETDALEFENVEVIKANKETLLNRLENTRDSLNKIGSVNLLSLEVYDSVKKEYDSVREKSRTIEKEKESILKIIHEIDVKKKKIFLKTFNDLNEIFSRNFSSLSTKGLVSLELENKKDPFEQGSGVQVIVKTGHGKYFDVTSLSGGEQTLVALSLIFAIQELKPYAFYILDEIDAALDKRNSERLAELLKKYMKKGQYIIITHNDDVISHATNLYGVSMHDGISKIVSLKI